MTSRPTYLAKNRTFRRSRVVDKMNQFKTLYLLFLGVIVSRDTSLVEKGTFNK
jgi:hypothetical protein